ncbi:hypothetical protein TI39_contig380g00026 [Zymoseptoria brevis]|uniref:Sld7 C-terminal domain-containing protein n=1 Tax=Zymoseptoria brevis TaxID=1047168 RepID=A0A0F4GNG5_9PEZI|nr:hypothetical protein TI39_contig380g00026 [Zymoseptoria brevis]
MESEWHGDIALGGGEILGDIFLQSDTPDCLPAGASLRFLSLVEVERVPLYLSIGKALSVSTAVNATESWFSKILLGNRNGQQTTWWQSARTESPLGILVEVDNDKSAAHMLAGRRVTELLFYAARDASSHEQQPLTPPKSSPESNLDSEPSPRLRLYALPLCSELHVSDLTPPPSPGRQADDVVATFLASPSKPAEVINRPPVRKRKSAADAFDEATERKRQARRQGGAGISAAAASGINTDMAAHPSLKHRRSISNTHSVPLQSRPLSRSPSIASNHSFGVREPSVPAANRKSTLSRMQSAPSVVTSPASSTEQKNKDYIAKVVMAGMRLYGLVQMKTRKSRANSAAASPALDTSFEDLENERKQSEEYKLIYHQAFKGTCLAFRKQIADSSLQIHTEALRATVDRLLAVFCNDPLTLEAEEDDDNFTPGGRKLFGSSALPGSEKGNPFVNAFMGNGSKSNTPSLSKTAMRDNFLP